MDGTGRDFRRPVVTAGSTGDAEFRNLAGAFELVVTREGGGLQTGPAGLRPDQTRVHVAEHELQATPGSSPQFEWGVRRSNEWAYLLRLDFTNELLYLYFFPYAAPAIDRLTPQIQVQGVRRGRPITVAWLVEAERFLLYVDQTLVPQANVLRPSPIDYVLPDFGIFGRPGTVRTTGFRIYSSPSSSGP